MSIDSVSSPIRGEDARRAARNIGALIAASIISKGLLFGWQLILAPWLGVSAYGIYSTVSALLVIGASAASFSMGLIVIRDVARDPKQAGTYWTAMLFIQTIFGGFAYLGMIGGALLSGYSESIIAYTGLAGLSLFIDLAGNMGHDLLIAREKIVVTASVEVLHGIARIGLAFLALNLGWGLAGVYLATILAGILRSAALCGFNLRTGTRPARLLDRPLARRLLIDSAPLALSGFLFLIYQHTDKLMTTAIIGESNTGYLGPAFIINFGVIEIFSTTVMVAVYPLLSRAYGGGENAQFGFLVEKLAAYMMLVSLPVALLLSLYAPEIIALLFPDGQYAPTAAILSILIWYTMITMVVNVFSKGMLVQNRQRFLVLIRSAGLLLNIALTGALLHRFQDVRGAVVASVLAEALVIFLLIGRFRAAGWDWRRLLPAAWKLGLLGLTAGLMMLGLKPSSVILSAAAGMILYTAGVLYGGILRVDDWDLLYRLAAAMPFGGLIRRFWKRPISVNW